MASGLPIIDLAAAPAEAAARIVAALRDTGSGPNAWPDEALAPCTSAANPPRCGPITPAGHLAEMYRRTTVNA